MFVLGGDFALYLLLVIPTMIIGFIAQARVKSTFQRWSLVPSSSGMSGAEMARAILDRNGLTHVPVHSSQGQLSDHYDPTKRTVNLSPDVFGGRSVSSVSVAAHEVGHALQHQAAYAPLAVRSAIVPATSFASKAANGLITVGMLLFFFTRSQSPVAVAALQIGVILFLAVVLFQMVTLPVEFNASRRAKRQLLDMGLVPEREQAGTAHVLNAAAMTYVAAALAAIAQLAYFAALAFGGRR